MSNSATIEYFGRPTVEAAVADFFVKNGLTEDEMRELMAMVVNDEDNFFQMVCNFIENKG